MIVVLESLDEYTKGVQAQLLCDYFNKNGVNARLLQSSVPDSVKCSIVDAWSNLNKIEEKKQNVYTSTLLNASERYLRLKADIGVIENESIGIFDRYSCTNILNQMCKIEVAEWDKYIEWAVDIEHNKLGIPEPDLTIYLSIDTVAYKVEGEKLNNMVQKSSAAKYCISKLGWNVIDCCSNGVYRTKENISSEIIRIVEDYYKMNYDISGNKKYHYYITYSTANKGFGSITINYSKKIDTPERINEVGDLLSKKLKSKCIIINVMELNGSDKCKAQKKENKK